MGPANAESAFRGRAGVSAAVPGILPGTPNVGAREIETDVRPLPDAPGKIPGAAGETPALPRNALRALSDPLSITPGGNALPRTPRGEVAVENQMGATENLPKPTAHCQSARDGSWIHRKSPS